MLETTYPGAKELEMNIVQAADNASQCWTYQLESSGGICIQSVTQENFFPVLTNLPY